MDACPSWRRGAKTSTLDLFSRATKAAAKDIMVELYRNKATKGRNPSLFTRGQSCGLGPSHGLEGTLILPQPPRDLKQGGRSHWRVIWALPGVQSRPLLGRSILLIAHAHVLSRAPLCATPWTQPARLLCPWDSPGWNTGVGLPCPPAGDLPDPGIEPVSPASPALAGGFFTTAPPGKPGNIPTHKYYRNK